MQSILKWFLLLILFAPFFVFCFRQKKWYLYLACGLIGLLPDQFAIEISKSLPLLTGQRVLILILLGFFLWKCMKQRSWKPSIPLLIYFAINVLISLVNMRYGIVGELKRIAIMLLEEVMLILMVAELIEDRRELDRCMDAMILSCVAMSFVGMIQTIFEFDIASVLKLVEARAALQLTQRMGMIRAFGTTNAIIYGCYCAFMAMVIFYRLERTGKQRYSLALALTLVAMICTLSRSSWLCILCIVGLLFVVRPRKLMKRCWPAVAAMVALCLLLSCINRDFGNAILQTGKSTLNTVLSAVNIDPLGGKLTPGGTDGAGDATEETQDPSETERPPMLELPEEFGDNAKNPTRSRMVEWTAVKYMLEEGEAAFGYGYNAFPRGKLHYFYPQFGHWTVAKTLDVGLLAVVTESGFVGLAAYLGLLLFLLLRAFRGRGQNGSFTFNKLMLYMLPLYLLLNFMAAFTGPVWLFIGLFYASGKLDAALTPDAGQPADDTWRL